MSPWEDDGDVVNAVHAGSATETSYSYSAGPGAVAVWLDHSCQEWIIAAGPDRAAVAAEVRAFADRLLAAAAEIEVGGSA